ncbi:hypothetical protein BH09VER1_BH09VER1_24490 [soil metagenome]
MIFCRCFQFKQIIAYKDRCGFEGYQDATKRYLKEESHQSGGAGCDFGGAYYIKTWDRYTCGYSYESAHGPDDVFCSGPGSVDIISDTYKETHGSDAHTDGPGGSNVCCGDDDGHPRGPDNATDTYQLSDEYTKEMLEADVDMLLDGPNWGDMAWGDRAEPYFTAGGSVEPGLEEGGAYPPATAFYYTDDVDNPTWIQKSRVRFIPSGNKYCEIFYPQDGSACTRTIVDCTAGEETTVDPPDAPGYKIIQRCCDPGECA